MKAHKSITEEHDRVELIPETEKECEMLDRMFGEIAGFFGNLGIYYTQDAGEESNKPGLVFHYDKKRDPIKGEISFEI